MAENAGRGERKNYIFKRKAEYIYKVKTSFFVFVSNGSLTEKDERPFYFFQKGIPVF